MQCYATTTSYHIQIIAIAVNESTRGNRWRRRALFGSSEGLRSSVFYLPYARQLNASAAGIDLHVVVVGLSQIQI